MPTKTFPGRYESLEKIASFIRQEAESIGFSHADVFAIETAVDEAVSNIIEHAYQGEDKGEIVCTCIAESEHIIIILEDTGLPFNPKDVPAPNLKAPLKSRKDHGLGIFMMQQWMDEVRFDFNPQHNRLTLVKYKEKIKQ